MIGYQQIIESETRIKGKNHRYRIIRVEEEPAQNRRCCLFFSMCLYIYNENVLVQLI